MKLVRYDTWYDVMRPKICHLPCSLNHHFIVAFYVGILLFPRHCIFHFAILKSLSLPWSSMLVINANQNYRRNIPPKHVNPWPEMQNAIEWKMTAVNKICQTQQNVFMLQNYISQLIEIVIMCIAYKLLIVVETGH